MEAKPELRKRMLAARASIPPENRQAWSSAIQNELFASARWAEARSVLAYWSLEEEVDTRPILQAALDGDKRLYLPRCVPGEKRFTAVPVGDLEYDLVPGAFRGIREPRPEMSDWPKPDEIDLILVPAVAFDMLGYRVGFGAGMFDRFLFESPTPFRLGLGFRMQVLDVVPHDPHDQPLDAILTEIGRIDIMRR